MSILFKTLTGLLSEPEVKPLTLTAETARCNSKIN